MHQQSIRKMTNFQSVDFQANPFGKYKDVMAIIESKRKKRFSKVEVDEGDCIRKVNLYIWNLEKQI